MFWTLIKVPFFFDEKCIAFTTLNDKLTSTPIFITLDWEVPFELMCDVSDYIVGAILDQWKNKLFHAIYYVSKTLNEAQLDYDTNQKEFLAIVFAFDKFQPYLISNKVIVFMDHLAITYLMTKKDVNPHIIRWGSFFQEFDLEIKDKK